jgi:hypothetical protein
MASEARIWPLREAMTIFTGGHSRSSAWSTQAVRIVRAARWVNWQVVRVSGLVVIAGRDKIGSAATGVGRHDPIDQGNRGGLKMVFVRGLRLDKPDRFTFYRPGGTRNSGTSYFNNSLRLVFSICGSIKLGFNNLFFVSCVSCLVRGTIAIGQPSLKYLFRGTFCVPTKSTPGIGIVYKTFP